jgi:hypothetical protein
MRKIYLSVVLALAVPLAAADLPAISAQEIARHLGIYSWRVPRALLPDHYTFAVRRIEKGKLGDYVGSIGLYAKGDLVICAHEEGGEVIVTADSGEAIGKIRGRFGHSIVAELPKDAALGVFPVFADYKMDAKKGMTGTGKIEDIVDGAVLILEERP